MAGLDPAIHVFTAAIEEKTWMPGTSPGMTILIDLPNAKLRPLVPERPQPRSFKSYFFA